MPEIGEGEPYLSLYRTSRTDTSLSQVARVVHYIQKHLVGKTLSKVKAQVDENVFGKVGCSAEAFEKALMGKKVLGAKQQGKYFWYVFPRDRKHRLPNIWVGVRFPTPQQLASRPSLVTLFVTASSAIVLTMVVIPEAVLMVLQDDHVLTTTSSYAFWYGWLVQNSRRRDSILQT